MATVHERDKQHSKNMNELESTPVNKESFKHSCIRMHGSWIRTIVIRIATNCSLGHALPLQIPKSLIQIRSYLFE